MKLNYSFINLFIHCLSLHVKTIIMIIIMIVTYISAESLIEFKISFILLISEFQ